MDNDQEHITLGFFGAVAVGKTSINVQYIKHVFLQEHDPTLEDFFETTKKFGKTDKVTHLTIYDTAGQEQYSTLLPQHMRESEGFMLVFSVTDKSSFSKISSVYNKVLDIKEKDKVPMVLVGNKIDLREKRVVSTEEGKKLADELRIPYIETSAKVFRLLNSKIIVFVGKNQH